MNLVWFSVFMAFFGYVQGQASLDDCPPGLNRDEFLKINGETCYRFELFTEKYYDWANDMCKRNGGTLATIKDQATQDFIVAKMLGVFKNDKKIWIGLRDMQKPGNLIWEDGTPLNFSNFDNNEGDQDKINCVSMEPGHHNNRWTLSECTKPHAYVCEYKATPQVNPCPPQHVDNPYAVQYEGSCFRLDHTMRTYDAALYDCMSEKGSLAMIKSRHLDEYIRKFVTDLINPLHKVWIGLNDENRTGVFEWYDGTLVGYHNFATATTEVGMESCVVISVKDNGQWVDEVCSSAHPYVCQYNEELSTTWTTGAPTTTTTPIPTTPAPSTPAPVTSVPSTEAPTTSAPATVAPVTTESAAPAPSTAGSSTAVPVTSAPSTAAPGTSAFSTAAPSTAVSGTSAPSTAVPGTSAPSTVAPGTSAPGTSAPSTAAPDTSESSTAAPGTSAPSTTAPGTSAPSTAAPSTAAPDTTTPSTTIDPLK